MKSFPIDGPPTRMLLIAASLTLGTIHTVALAQPKAFGLKAMQVRPAEAAKKKPAEEAENDPSLTKFPGGATLKTDPEQQRLLKRAEQCVTDGRLDLAVILWQKVLDEAGDTLMTRDGRTYTSLAEEVERTLASSNPRALQAYRVSADGEAQAALARATPETEEDALAVVVRRYFLSSLGDEACFKLGCYALDRLDFVGASRLFSKLLDRHPDPTIPRAEILMRLAIASAHVGDRETAYSALTEMVKAPGPHPLSETLDLVARDIEQTTQAVSAIAAASLDWRMALGNPSRSGRMRPLPAEATSRTLAELWTQEMPLTLTDQGSPNPAVSGIVLGGGMGIVRGRAGNQPALAPVSREQLMEQWRQNKWTPTPQLLFDGGRVYLKTMDDLQCFSSGAITDKPLWRSVWGNQFEMDGMSFQQAQMAQMYGMNGPQINTNRPRSLAEVLLFGDRVHQGMTIAGGVIYSLEGRRYPRETGPAPAGQPKQFQWNSVPRRTRTNFLAAYQAANGKAKWHRGASDDDQDGSQDVGFLSAPLPYGNLLLAPITDGGTIWLYALNSENGTTVWKAYLCDEPQGGCSPWSPVGVSVEGRDAYVVCGAGVVFAVDAVSGVVRWAVRYPRDGGQNQNMRNVYGVQTMLLDLKGWDDDIIIPSGKSLLVMASDSDKLVALDRRTGKQLWESPRTSPFGSTASYCVGVMGRGLFVAGRNVVRRYDMPSGRLVWEKEIGDSFGRGVLTDDALYLPVKDSILKLDLEKGKEIVQVGVALATNDPVGNLYSDGEKLWVTGGGRVYAMTNLDHRLAMLEKQIEGGDGDAQLNRMRIFAKAKQPDKVLADLRGAYERFQKSHSADEAALKFFAAINELRLTQEKPGLALELLADYYTRPTAPALGKDAIGRRGDIISSALSTIKLKKAPGQAAAVLGLAPLLDQDYLLLSAAQALDATAQPDKDVERLKQAVAGETPAAQAMAAGALAKAAPQEAKEMLSKLLTAPDDRVKLAAARALVNLGERGPLPVFLQLLESENPRMRAHSHQSLRALTGQTIAFSSDAVPEERAKGVAAWKTWLDKEGAAAKLSIPLPDAELPLGRILIASYDQQTLIEFDASRKERWRTRLPGFPWACQGLPNGNRLISFLNQNAIIEFSEDGKEVWRKDRLPGHAQSLQRLPNGNTLIACVNTHNIVEITPSGESTTFNIPGGPACARRLENGNTLISLMHTNRVIEIDKNQKTVWEARNLNGPSCVERLENGNTLVVQQYTGQVVEIDAKGQKTGWAAKVSLVNPTCVKRLPSGTTLITDQNGLHELDEKGEAIRWEHRLNNTTCVSSY